MGIGASLFLVAIGAILAFAVTVDPEGFNLNTVGWILMIVGGIGLLFSLLFWSSFAPFGAERRRGDRVVERDRDVV